MNPLNEPVSAAGVVISVDAYGKHTAARIYIRDGKVELVPVSTGRSLGAAGRVAAGEMELVAHAVSRGMVTLKAPAKATLKVDQ